MYFKISLVLLIFLYYFSALVNTHVHADHITGTGEIKKRLPTCKSVIAGVSKAKADVQIKEGDVINFGSYSLECYSTPGHTDGEFCSKWLKPFLYIVF